MDYLAVIQLQAKYNQWINQSLYDKAERLTDDERRVDLGAFFGSVMGTFNHLVVGDSIWVRRFLDAPAVASESVKESTLKWLPEPASLDSPLFSEWSELRAMRDQLDSFILRWSSELTSADLNTILSYNNTQGRPFSRPLGHLLIHFFNHQTHHRGQATTLLFQSGIDPEATDLLAVLPD